MSPTQTIVHPYLDGVLVKYFCDIPKSICNINHAKTALQKHHICLTESDHDYIIEGIEHIEKLS